MIAAAYLTGLATGVALVLVAVARQQRHRDRDRAAVTQHLAMVRAMSTVTTPHRDRLR